MTNRQTCFTINGIEYNEGTIVKMYGNEFVFRYYDTDVELFSFKYKNSKKIFVCSMDEFINNLESVTDAIDMSYISMITQRRGRHVSFKEELLISGMLYAWLWYIVIMVVGSIFYNRTAIWIITTYVFVGYRKRKIKDHKDCYTWSNTE